MITLTIDNKKVVVEDGATILAACEMAGSKVPTLCHEKKLLSFGACRICLVEVEGTRTKFTPSCTTPATDGMVVKTMTEALIKARRTILELLLISHPLDCPVCDKAGECSLQDLVYEYGVSGNRFKGIKFTLPVDHISPLIERDLNRCILCGKCVRICDELQGVSEISFVNRGMRTKIGTDFDRPLDCEFCGQCISVCPVGALTSKLFKYKARLWELENIPTICPYCSNGCTLILGIKDNQIKTITSHDDIGINEGNLCAKGRFGYEFVANPLRLKKPLVKRDGKFEEVDWDEALGLVVTKFNEIKTDSGANSIGALGSARLTNEEIYLFQHLIRQGLGTNNIDHGGGYSYQGLIGLKESLDYPASTNSIHEIRETKAILLLRADLNETHPNIKIEVNLAINRHQARLIVADNKRIKLSANVASNLIYKPGTELTLINGLINLLIKNDLINKDFIKEKTTGFDKLLSCVKKYTPEYVEGICEVNPQDLELAARVYAEAEKACIIVTCGMGLCGNNRDIALAASNLALLTGNIGKESSGVYILPEKNNSQGALDMGAVPGFLPGYMPVDKPGYSAFQMLEAGKLKGMFIVGENPVMTYPLPDVQKALESLEFLVVQDMFMTPTAELADVILPVGSFAEKEGTYANLGKRVQKLKKALLCHGETKSDLEIFIDLCQRMGCEITTDNNPLTSFIKEESNPLTSFIKGEFAGEDKPWKNNNWKGKFIPVESDEIKTDRDELLLVSTGSHLYSGSLSAWSPHLLEVKGEACVEVNYKDAKKIGLDAGDPVKISSKNASIKLKARLSDNIPEGVAVVETHPLLNVMVLFGQKMMPIKGKIGKE
ncbi:MAG: molybdopterin-dependent oxidoreductase [bacterium]|nr:molybdopterin-dependent oxidoreductase [bacterium]